MSLDALYGAGTLAALQAAVAPRTVTTFEPGDGSVHVEVRGSDLTTKCDCFPNGRVHVTDLQVVGNATGIIAKAKNLYLFFMGRGTILSNQPSDDAMRDMWVADGYFVWRNNHLERDL